MITIPLSTTKKWFQTNTSDIFGNLFSTRNIDLTKDGYLSLSRRVKALYRDVGSGGTFDQVLSIVFSPIGNLVFTSDAIFEMDLTNTASSALVENTDTGYQSCTQYGDGIYWNGRIYQTGDTATKYWNGSVWTSASITLTTSVPHPMCVFESLQYLAVATDKNIVKLYDTSHTLMQTLTLPAEIEVQWLIYKDSNLYIGTKSLSGENARMYIWNGSGTSAQRAITTKGDTLMSGCEYDNSIAVVSSNGQLLVFNGAGFVEIATFPVYTSDYRWTFNGQRITRRGMVADGDRLYLNVEGQVIYNNNEITLPNQPSGLWCYSSKTGLYHMAGLSSDTPVYSTVTAVDITTNTLTLGTAVETQTGEPVMYSQVTSAIGGITTNRVYYAIRVSSTSFKLAETYDNAIAGTAVDITSDPATHNGKLVCIKGGEYGNVYNSSYSAGAVAIIPESNSMFDLLCSRLLFGGWRINEDSMSTTYSSLCSLVVGENRGTFVTQKIFSTNIEDIYQKIVVKGNGLFNANDKIIVKYRYTEKQYYPITPQSFQGTSYNIVWTDTDTFTVNNSKWDNVEAGEEIEIIAGAGAGYTAHITSITGSSGSYTVVIDETLPLISVSDTSQVLVNNWIKGGILTSSTSSMHITTSVNKPSKWLQVKCELRGEGVQVEELQIINKTQLPSV